MWSGASALSNPSNSAYAHHPLHFLFVPIEKEPQAQENNRLARLACSLKPENYTSAHRRFPITPRQTTYKAIGCCGLALMLMYTPFADTTSIGSEMFVPRIEAIIPISNTLSISKSRPSLRQAR